MSPVRRLYIGEALYVAATTILAGLGMVVDGRLYLLAVLLTLPVALAYPFWGAALYALGGLAEQVAGWLTVPVLLLGFAGVASVNVLAVNAFLRTLRGSWSAWSRHRPMPTARRAGPDPRGR